MFRPTADITELLPRGPLGMAVGRPRPPNKTSLQTLTEQPANPAGFFGEMKHLLILLTALASLIIANAAYAAPATPIYTLPFIITKAGTYVVMANLTYLVPAPFYGTAPPAIQISTGASGPVILNLNGK